MIHFILLGLLRCELTHVTFYSPINQLLRFILSRKTRERATQSFTKVCIFLSRFRKCVKTTQLRHFIVQGWMKIFNSVKVPGLLYDLVHIYQMNSLGIPPLHQVVFCFCFETVQKIGHHCFKMYVCF